MVDQARYDVFEASDFFADGMSARPKIPGTVPYLGPDRSPNDPALTGLGEDDQPVTAIPVTVDTELVVEGQERYDIFCTPCHGAAGEGNGRATTFGFPAPPSLLTSTLSDGEMFDVITNGRGQMFPYGYRVKPDERWAVIAYIRALQLRGGAVDPQELTPDELNQLGAQP